jgi:carbonic anhydrase/acetyltransferase-like protein (isoleucine patch superfamily)
MLVSHLGKQPTIHASAWVAPNAVVCGDVRIGPDTRVMYGAQIIAEGGRIEIGGETIVMENAVLRSTALHSLRIGNNCLVGPQTHVVGCEVEDEVFIATGAAIFHGAKLGRGCEVRIRGVVHIKTTVEPGVHVPIGWVAVGTPASILPPSQHDAIWQIQAQLDFPLTVYGIDRSEADMVKITRGLAASLAGHRDDV